jgi:GH15 family glucan-1,4-alpha-glucosidase
MVTTARCSASADAAIQCAVAAARPEFFPIDAYGVIGDLHTAVLINPHGGIDWACFPYFDSPSCFARLLDRDIGGGFSIAPERFAASELSYLPGTNILRTDFWSLGAAVRLVDFMPVLEPDGSRTDPHAAYVCREVSTHGAEPVALQVRFDPRPDYARGSSMFEASVDGRRVRCGDLTLLSSAAIAWDTTNRVGRLVVAPGERARWILCAGGAEPADCFDTWFDESRRRTERYWLDWIAQCRYDGLWRELVERSALTLKLLTFRPTGAIVASPTTSLPAGIGGTRNWDYRFNRLHDAAQTLNALFLLGFVDEAKQFAGWLLQLRPGDAAPLRTLYPVSDSDTTEEVELAHLAGYRGSRPVRIGNAARDQVQLDVYGEILDTLFLYSVYGESIDEPTWRYLRSLGDRICERWRNADDGVWEMRGCAQHFTHSKVMCWIGLDRAIRIGLDHGFDGPFERWRSEMDEIKEWVLRRCVGARGRHLHQSASSTAVDASTLLAPILSFVAADDAVAVETVERVLEELTSNGLVRRYLGDDGIDGGEGAFNVCTFWLVEALALVGRPEEAHAMFRGVVELGGHLGLYAEQTDVDERIALGNFPCASSHVGLINAALTLNASVKQASGRTLIADRFDPDCESAVHRGHS